MHHAAELAPLDVMGGRFTCILLPINSVRRTQSERRTAERRSHFISLGDTSVLWAAITVCCYQGRCARIRPRAALAE